jgi:hypothetical protein
MVVRNLDQLAALYEQDETEWLDLMAELIDEGRYEELDFRNLSEYLKDMARRDRREVESRLRVLIAHLLKWTYQPERRSRSWGATIIEQQEELILLLESGTLRKHATAILSKVYSRAVGQARAETGLPGETFPAECPWTLDQLESTDLTEADTP